MLKVTLNQLLKGKKFPLKLTIATFKVIFSTDSGTRLQSAPAGDFLEKKVGVPIGKLANAIEIDCCHGAKALASMSWCQTIST